ncbi:MAG: T9SS type A sorting domain-containing protein, partial [Candidatus Dadabacteria bacterium]|nr:T9SS type A sorting domain-containing protein [Candidatus Dadabacteria bacterium]
GEAAGLEESAYPVQPLAADPDGDGRLEAIFNVAGDIYVIEFSGETTEGWPARGEADPSVPFAAARGDGGRLHIFSAGGIGDLRRSPGSGLTVDRDRSSISRVDLQAVDMAEGGWRAWRKDAGGSGRQEAASSPDPGSGGVEDRSFICYPNPVSGGSFTARMAISGAAKVSAFVLDLQGEKVASAGADYILNGGMVPFEVRIGVEDLVSGIYICRVEVTGAGWRWSGARKIAIVR